MNATLPIPPTASGNGHDPSTDTAPPDRRKRIHQRPSASAERAATPSPARSGFGTHPVRSRLASTAHRLAATLMVLAMIGSALGGMLPASGHPHKTYSESADLSHEATLVSGIYPLYALALHGWEALVGDDICGDCNLPVDDGCRCECYSGGYDPNDPACQF